MPFTSRCEQRPVCPAGSVHCDEEQWVKVSKNSTFASARGRFALGRGVAGEVWGLYLFVLSAYFLSLFPEGASASG